MYYFTVYKRSWQNPSTYWWFDSCQKSIEMSQVSTLFSVISNQGPGAGIRTRTAPSKVWLRRKFEFSSNSGWNPWNWLRLITSIGLGVRQIIFMELPHWHKNAGRLQLPPKMWILLRIFLRKRERVKECERNQGEGGGEGSELEPETDFDYSKLFSPGFDYG